MCGIVGYAGPRDPVKLVFDGLRRLEYRGYDSAGISVLLDGSISTIKASGKLHNLESMLPKLPENSSTGIGHTRWATHGAPTTENAHPHAAGVVSLIHNGIIENYFELKEGLLKLGAKFNSETDSEVIAQLLSFEITANPNIDQAILNVLKKLRGAYALGFLISSEPETIYVVKSGAPMAIGLGTNETFFASDAAAFVGEVENVVFLEDHEWGKITAKGFECFNLENQRVELKPMAFNWNRARVEKQGFKHFMLKEIYEQPIIIAETINRIIDQPTGKFNHTELGLTRLNLKDIDGIHIVACGTAYIAGLMAQYFLEPLLQMPVRVELASEFRYRLPYLTAKQLVISISQSGETADTLACVVHAKSFACQKFSICNTPHSAIPRASDSVLLMDAGQEVGVASTKAFTSQVLCLYLWGLAYAEIIGKINRDELQPIITELRSLPLHVESAINNQKPLEQLAKKYYEKTNFLYVGRGLNYPLALEGALKLKEISYIHAEGYSAGELKHGPIALIDRHMPVVAIAPRDSYYEKTISNIEEIKAREGLIIGVGNHNDEKLKKLSTDFIGTPETNDAVFQVIINTVPVQLLAYFIAVMRGTDVDQPRNLAKSVTVE